MTPAMRAVILKRHGGLETATDAQLEHLYGTFTPAVQAEIQTLAGLQTATTTKGKTDEVSERRRPDRGGLAVG